MLCLEAFFDQVWGLALFLVGELAGAPPGDAPVFVGGMPDLGTEETAVVSTDQPGGKDAVVAVVASDGFPTVQFPLHQLPLG